MSKPHLLEQIEAIACARSEEIAVEQGDRNLDYGSLRASANGLAHFLLAHGFGTGKVIAVMVSDRIKLIETMLGVYKSGGIFAPLDEGEPPPRLTGMVGELEPDLFIIETRHIGRLASLAQMRGKPARALLIDRPAGFEHPGELVTEIGRLEGDLPAEAPAFLPAPDDPCYIYFTSGSSGEPKGVLGRFKSVQHFIQWEVEAFAVGNDARVSQISFPTYDAFLRDVFVPLSVGGRVCIPDTRETVLDPDRLADWLEQSRITLVHCVPSLFRNLLKVELNARRFPDLETVIMAGEHIFPTDIERWWQAFADRIGLVNFYGATESTMTKFCYRIQASDRSRRVIPIGKPMPGVRAIILDEELRICEQGTVGELYIRTPYLSLGYYRRPQQTQQVFVANPFDKRPGQVIFKTGDTARLLADGQFQLVGRKDHQIKLRGNRIEPGEIEAVVKKHESVKEVVVVAKGSTTAQAKLVAFLTVRDATGVTEEELWRHTRDQLPEYMVPTFFVLETMPLTRTGKIDRNALPDPGSGAGLAGEYTAPRNSVETRLAEIWSEVLGVEKPGIHDSFFRLGGHSLVATQVISRIRSRFEVDISLIQIFNTPTIAELAEVIQKAQDVVVATQEGDLLAMVENLSEAEVEDMLLEIDDGPSPGPPATLPNPPQPNNAPLQEEKR